MEGRVVTRLQKWGNGPGLRVPKSLVAEAKVACTLAAVKLGIPVAHVEAGLRSFDRGMPEEINRLVTDTLGDLLLVSEPAGEENLRREGIADGRIRHVGNVMIDTLVRELPAARALGVAERLGLAAAGYAYVTLHRPSNVDEPGRLARLVELLRSLGARLPVAFPVHPRTRERLRAAGLEAALAGAPGVRLLEPLGYRESRHGCPGSGPIILPPREGDSTACAGASGA